MQIGLRRVNRIGQDERIRSLRCFLLKRGQLLIVAIRSRLPNAATCGCQSPVHG